MFASVCLCGERRGKSERERGKTEPRPLALYTAGQTLFPRPLFSTEPLQPLDPQPQTTVPNSPFSVFNAALLLVIDVLHTLAVVQIDK